MALLELTVDMIGMDSRHRQTKQSVDAESSLECTLRFKQVAQTSKTRQDKRERERVDRRM